MLFLLTDNQGRALLMAQAASKAEADDFGRNHLPEFCGDSVELDAPGVAAAEDFWWVKTVRVVHVPLDPSAVSHQPRRGPVTAIRQVWIRGPKLPDDVESSGLLTPEDHRDLTLDHITRTSDLIYRLEISKRA